MVQIDRAQRLHTILFVQDDLGRHTADRGGDRRDSDGGQICDGAVARQYEHRPFLVRRRKLVQTHVPSGYSAGHAASASQMRESSCDGGCLE